MQNPQSGLDLLEAAPATQASGLDLLDEPKKSLGVGGRIQEAAHNLIEGAASGVAAGLEAAGTALRSASRALGAEADETPIADYLSSLGPAARQIGKSIAPSLPEGADPNSTVAHVERFVGGAAPLIAAGAAGGLPAVAGLASLQGVQAGYDDAKSRGATEDQANLAAALNGLANGALVFTPGGQAGKKLAQRFGSTTTGKLVASLARMDKETGGEATSRLVQVLKGMAAGGAKGGAIMGSLEGFKNFVAQQTYDKDRGLWDNVMKSATIGAIGSSLIEGGVKAVEARPEAPASRTAQEPARSTQTEQAPEVNLPPERTAGGLPGGDKAGIGAFLENNRPEFARPKKDADPYAEPAPELTSYNESIGAGKGLAERVTAQEHPLIEKIEASGAKVVRVETGHEDPPMPAAYDPETKTIYIASENKDWAGSLVYETFGRHIREKDPSLWEDLRRAVEQAAPERVKANTSDFKTDMEAAGIPMDTATGARGPGIGRTVQEARPVIEAILKAAAKSPQPQTLMQRFFKALSGWLDSIGLESRKWLKATREDQALLASYPKDAQMPPATAVKVANKALEILEKAAESQERVKPDKAAMLAGVATREGLERGTPKPGTLLEAPAIPLPSEFASGKIRKIGEQATAKEQLTPAESPTTGQMTPEGQQIQTGAKRFDIEESPAGSSDPNRRILPDVRRRATVRPKQDERGTPVEGVTTREGTLARRALKEGVGRTAIGKEPYSTVNPASTKEGKARGLAGREVYMEEHSPVNMKATAAEAEKRLAEGGAGYAKELLDKSRSGASLDLVEQAALGIASGRANDAAPIFDDTSPISRVASDLTWEWNKQGTSPAQQLRVRRELGGHTTKSVKSTIAGLYRSASDSAANARKGIERQLSKNTTPEKRAQLKGQLKEIEAKEAVRLAKLKDDLLQAFGSEGDMIRAAEANLADMGRALHIISRSRASTKNKIREWLYISMMSAPPTHIRNFIGNVVNTGYNGVVNKWVQGIVGTVRGDLDAASIPEAVAYTRTLLSSVRDGAKFYADSMRSDLPAWEEYLLRHGTKHDELGLQGDKAHSAAIGGAFAAGMRKLSTTEMLAMDQAFKVILTKAQVHALAFRRAKADGLQPGTPEFDAAVLEVQANGADPIWSEAFDHSQHITYNAHDSALADMVTKGRDWIDNHVPVFPLGTALVPFVRVGEAVYKTGLEPVLKPFQTMYRFARDKTSASYAYDKQTQAMDVAKSILGIGLTALVYEAFWDDKNGLPMLTGSRARGGAGQLQARTIPAHMMSLDGGKTYHSIWWTGPLGIFLTGFADVRDAVQADPNDSNLITGGKAALGSLLNTMGDQTYMKNLGDIFHAVENGDESPYATATIAQSLITQPIPALLRTSMRAADPWVRKSTVRTHEDKTALESAFTPEALLYQAVPLPSNAPPIKYDRWGRPMRKDALGSGLLRILNIAPANEQAATIHRLDMLINRYNDRVAAGELGNKVIPYNPIAPAIYYKLHGDDRPHYWSDEEYATLTRESGSRAAAVLGGMPLNYDNPTPRDIDIMQRVYSREVSAVKASLLQAQRAAAPAR